MGPVFAALDTAALCSPEENPMRALTAVAATAVAVSLVAAPASAYAARTPGSGSGASTMSLVNLTKPGVAPAWNNDITFTVNTSATYPYVQVNCYQNGALVYSNSKGMFAAYPWGHDFVLSSYYWTGGAANCTAELYTSTKRGTTTLASMSFGVSAQ
jgi:hypothetical protein